MSDNLFQTGIRPAVDEYLKKKSEEQRDYGDYWSASSAGYCMRLNIMRRLKIPKVPELEDKAALTRIFEVGHIFHEWMQRITKDTGLSIASEVELQDEDLMVRGHFDDLILIKTNLNDPETDPDRLILYDYKTAHSASFNYAKNRPIGHYHKAQLSTYMYMLRKHGLKPFQQDYESDKEFEARKSVQDGVHALTEGRILSISKDDLRMDEKQLLWNDDTELWVKTYWTMLNKAWKEYQESGALPDCTCLEHDGGFLGKRSAKGKIYNDYFWNEVPCSLEWFELCKKEGKIK